MCVGYAKILHLHETVHPQLSVSSEGSQVMHRWLTAFMAVYSLIFAVMLSPQATSTRTSPLFRYKVLLCSLGWHRTHCVVKTGLNTQALLCRQPESQDYRHQQHAQPMYLRCSRVAILLTSLVRWYPLVGLRSTSSFNSEMMLRRKNGFSEENTNINMPIK